MTTVVGSIRAERRHALTIPAPATLAATGLALVAAVLYSWIGLFRHDHFGSNAFDLGIQDQTVWGYSQFQMLPNTILGIPNLLGDHFHPILFVLAPFYWLWDSPGVLLVSQAVLLALASIPIYLWGAERLGRLAALAFQASFLVFWGVLAAVVFDFHHIVFAVPGISAALYATLNRRNGLLWLGVAVALLSQEDVSLTVLMLGVYIVLVQRRLALGGTLVALGATWFAIAIEVVMPALAQGSYLHWTYQQLGTGPVSAALHVLRHPISSLELLFTPLHKAKVWIGLLGNWLFLPLLSPLALIAVPSFLARFWSSTPNLWSFQYQYSMLVAPILAFAAMDTAARVAHHLPARWARIARVSLSVGSLLVAVVAVLLIQPLRELTSYVSTARAAEIQSCLDVIPPDAGVAATSRLVPHLSEREQIYMLPAGTTSQYLAIDLSSNGPLSTNYAQYIRDLLKTSLANGYGVACSKGQTAVLVRGRARDDLSPQMASFIRG